MLKRNRAADISATCAEWHLDRLQEAESAKKSITLQRQPLCVFEYLFQETLPVVSGDFKEKDAHLNELSSAVEWLTGTLGCTDGVTAFWLKTWLDLLKSILEPSVDKIDHEVVMNKLYELPLYCERRYGSVLPHEDCYSDSIEQLQPIPAIEMPRYRPIESIWEHLSDRFQTEIAWRCSETDCKHHKIKHAFENIPRFCEHMRIEHGLTYELDDMEVPHGILFSRMTPYESDIMTDLDGNSPIDVNSAEGDSNISN